LGRHCQLSGAPGREQPFIVPQIYDQIGQSGLIKPDVIAAIEKQRVVTVETVVFNLSNNNMVIATIVYLVCTALETSQCVQKNGNPLF
jgi:hypothetical protein